MTFLDYQSGLADHRLLHELHLRYEREDGTNTYLHINGVRYRVCVYEGVRLAWGSFAEGTHYLGSRSGSTRAEAFAAALQLVFDDAWPINTQETTP